MHMETSEWNVEGEALVMRVAKVSGRKYTIQETAAELEESSHETPVDQRGQGLPDPPTTDAAVAQVLQLPSGRQAQPLQGRQYRPVAGG